MDSNYSTRADRLVEAMAERDVECVLITSPIGVEYLTGFTGSNGACLVGPDSRSFLTDFRYEERVADGMPGWEVEIVRGDWVESLSSRLPGRTGIEDGHLTVRSAARLESAAGGGVELVAAGDLLEGLRRSKDASEIAAVAKAAELSDRILGEVFESGLIGRTEAEVAGQIVSRMREEGAEPSFLPIVAAGPNGADPHAEPGARRIEPEELVVIDMGSRLNGYCSDCTRTVATGELDDEAMKVYEVVLEANEAALAAVRSGAGCAAVDLVAREIIEAAGWGDRFGHGVGHGVGLEIHEDPRIGPRSTETLVEGDVVTIEPGVYLPGRLGVRIEDLVVVGSEGIEANLSSHPKTLTVTQ
jgi:Xaa-Pro aminopeptidase